MTDPEAWGIAPGYHDHHGDWRPTPKATAEALLEAMGADGRASPPTGDDRVRVVVAGGRERLEGRWTLETEDGGDRTVEGELPADLPLGYHELRRDDGHHVGLVVTPPACFFPDRLRTWGWAVQLYAARSGDSWGMGDLGDLRRLARWSAGQGAGLALINPLHAVLPIGTQQASPYSPSSRCYRNPLYLRVEEVPGASAAELDLESLAAAGRELNGNRLIDREAVWRLKLDALQRLWGRFDADPGFDRYCDEQGPALEAYATFCALSEHHGIPWPEWPAHLRHPESDHVKGFADANRDRVRFHQWLQWLTDSQLAAAGSELDVVQDLAVGVDAGGADAWLWQECFAHGASIGAPPDEFNTFGQDWGLAPFDPWCLRAARYEPFVRMLRAAFRHAGGVRIDHVMGLFRLFWVPTGARPPEGAYVRYPWKDLVAILALESHRAGAYVVGEDLGTVEDMVREELGARSVMSYRLMWFEPRPPRDYPGRSLAAVTTHDLPTIPGLW
ncbi:MAG TPA: 4-alpha-glucanotransferase, partial [Acidimicrobiales bacterium]|nr:4-alpha-glucanotransferase [Acidimicrobiales bacterium]